MFMLHFLEVEIFFPTNHGFTGIFLLRFFFLDLFSKTLFAIAAVAITFSFLESMLKRLNNLVKNKDLVIKIEDKGNNFVILNRCDYMSKLRKILEGTYKFK